MTDYSATSARELAAMLEHGVIQDAEGFTHDDLTDASALLWRYAEMMEAMPKCPCGSAATCLGVCEGDNVSYGCDRCCAHCEHAPSARCKPHQHEDGYCYALSDVPEFVTELLSELQESA